MQPQWLGARRLTWHEAQAFHVGCCERPNLEPWWSRLWRVRIPGEHRRAALVLHGTGVERTDSRGEQSFEAGVAAAHRRAQRPRERDGTCGARECAEATGLAITGNLRPGSCVHGSASGWAWSGQRAGSRGESDREALSETALAVVEREPARKHERPARAGTAPREGKALKGSSRNASGMKEGREATGSVGERRGPKDLERACG
jgi:hypothetical protein